MHPSAAAPLQPAPHRPETELDDCVDARTDNEIVAAVRDGDIASYAELYRRHYRMAGSVARRAGVSFDDADDVVAEAYMKVLRALHSGLGPTENFPGYLATAVRRVAWTAQELSWRYRPTDDALFLETPADIAEVESLASTAAGSALAALPQASQSLLWRVDVEGHRVADIALEAGKSPNSVSAAACRARKRLRAEYARRVGAA